jgi:hypothetical protein
MVAAPGAPRIAAPDEVSATHQGAPQFAAALARVLRFARIARSNPIDQTLRMTP